VITYRRTNIYKINLQDMSGLATNAFYVDNMGFTAT